MATCPVNRLHVCQTCVRDLPLQPNEPSRGRRLADALQSILQGSDMAQDSDMAQVLVLRRVPCLSGCLNPCNVSLRAPGKASLRFSRLGPDDATTLLEFAAQYIASPTGDIPDSEIPESLRKRLTARTPSPR